MVRIIKQLVIEILLGITASKEFRCTIQNMLYKAVFGTLDLIKRSSQFMYNKAIELGKVISYKVDCFIKAMSKSR